MVHKCYAENKRNRHIAYGERYNTWTYCACDCHMVTELPPKVIKKRARRLGKEEIKKQLDE